MMNETVQDVALLVVYGEDQSVEYMRVCDSPETAKRIRETTPDYQGKDFRILRKRIETAPDHKTRD